LHDGGTYGQGNTAADLVRSIDLQVTLSFMYYRYTGFQINLPCLHIDSLHS
jgi:hypothetical protein